MQDGRRDPPVARSGWQYFSSAAMPAREWFRVMRELAASMSFRCDVIPNGPAHRFAGYALALPGLTVMGGVSRDTVYRHTVRQPVDNGTFMLTVLLEGGYHVHQDHRDFVVNTGEAAALLSGEPFDAVTLPGRICRALTVVMSVDAFRDSEVQPRDLLHQPVHCDGAAMGLLLGYVDAITRITPDSTLPRLVGQHVSDLVLAALGASREAALGAGAHRASAAQLRQLKDDVRRRVGAGQPVHLALLARRHRISPSYVQKLFERERTNLSTFVCAERLERARRMLSSPRFARRKISAIALDCGFDNLAWFNRAFKRRYGITPSQMRAR